MSFKKGDRVRINSIQLGYPWHGQIGVVVTVNKDVLNIRLDEYKGSIYPFIKENVLHISKLEKALL